MKASRWTNLWRVILMAAASAGALSGCGGGDGDDDGGVDDGGGEAVVFVNGAWCGTRSSEGGETVVSIDFQQADGTLAGSYRDTSGFEGTLAGTVAGDDVEFAITLSEGAPGAVWTFSGAVNATGTGIFGDLTTTAGLNTLTASYCEK